MATEFDDEPSVQLEAVERRELPRGLIRDMKVIFSDGASVPAVEASRKGFFVSVDDPDYYRLGGMHEIQVQRGEMSFDCKVEVVRKEIDPRRGVALRIVHMSPVAEETLKQMFP